MSGGNSKISLWKSKGLSNEKFTYIAKSNKNQPAAISYSNARISLLFRGDPLKQNNITYKQRPIVNIYIVYRLISKTNNSSVTLENCLFGAVKLAKNADIDKYKYSAYGIGFDSKGYFSHPRGHYSKNVTTFGADMSSSTYANNKTRSILVIVKDFIQGIYGTVIYAEKMYSNNFVVDKTFCLSLHYNGDSSYLFVNGKEIINFKAKDPETAPYPLCLGKILKNFSLANMLETGMYGYVYNFSVDYWAITNYKILDIYKYLMKKNNII